MNDLLFYSLLIALLYYFFIYLPNQKKSLSPPPQPFTPENSTPTTDPAPVIEFPAAQFKPVNQEDPEIEKTLDQLIKNMQQLNQSLK